jgi:hypothetical protein
MSPDTFDSTGYRSRPLDLIALNTKSLFDVKKRLEHAFAVFSYDVFYLKSILGDGRN